MQPPSGEQYELRCGEQQVVITEVGGGLRSYTVSERPVVDGYGLDQMCTGARGQTLIPWPNRIDGGRYHFDGMEHGLALTEPGARNAIHGLTRWASWCPVAHDKRHLRMKHTLHAQPGWPFVLNCELDYRLAPGGLTVRTIATNAGAAPCPYATGAHPYLTAGTERIDTTFVQVPGSIYYPTDERGIPTSREPVEGTLYDLREPTELGERCIDVAYTELARGPDRRARVRLASPEGPSLMLWASDAYPYLQIFTGDTLPESERRRASLAVEPMTAAPNAFRTGDGLVVLLPDETHTTEWGIEPHGY